jgi:hypothetical protein
MEALEPDEVIQSKIQHYFLNVFSDTTGFLCFYPRRSISFTECSLRLFTF